MTAPVARSITLILSSHAHSNRVSSSSTWALPPVYSTDRALDTPKLVFSVVGCIALSCPASARPVTVLRGQNRPAGTLPS
eukprot:m.877364 g.877364  ORF g.877364 m.877364 type:complete len:80 (-) comp59828_c0_seq8:150-389(-)